MDIIITRNKYGSLFAVSTESPIPLFQFEYRNKNMGGPAWYFWLRSYNDPDIFKGKEKDFPMEFFKDACRAKLFISRPVTPLNSVTGLHEEINIIEGENYLKR